MRTVRGQLMNSVKYIIDSTIDFFKNSFFPVLAYGIWIGMVGMFIMNMTIIFNFDYIRSVDKTAFVNDIVYYSFSIGLSVLCGVYALYEFIYVEQKSFDKIEFLKFLGASLLVIASCGVVVVYGGITKIHGFGIMSLNNNDRMMHEYSVCFML